MGAASGKGDGAPVGTLAGALTSTVAAEMTPGGCCSGAKHSKARRAAARSARRSSERSKKSASTVVSAASITPRGILKRGTACGRRGKARAFLEAVLPRFLGGGAKISFDNSVDVAEFTRRLNRDTMPGDGTTVTMGLGRLYRRTSTALGPGSPPPNKAPVEERAWLTSAQRVQVLRKDMGDKRFFGAWASCRRETLRLKAARCKSRAEKTDFRAMPTSFKEARARADRLAAEVVAHAEEAALSKAPVNRKRPFEATPVRKTAKTDFTRSLPASTTRLLQKRRRCSERTPQTAPTVGAAASPPSAPDADIPGVAELAAWCDTSRWLCSTPA